jgi:exopolysaccharide biosynthesis protein
VGPSPKDGTPGTVPSTKVSSFVKNSGCTAGINANPFEPSTALEGEDRTVTGLAVSEGKILSGPAGAYDALVFYSAESAPRAAVLNQAGVPLPGGRGGADTYADPDKHTVEYAVGGFYRVLENGEITGRDGARHPRSAAGLSSGGGILYLLVIDGRRSGSRGATEAETGQILRRLGAEEGLCFDGGGSSALVLGDGKSAVRVLNRPIHRFIPGVERAVAICLGISFH